MGDRVTGYYSLGLVGYEVEVIDEEHVYWLYVGTQREQIRHKAKIYCTRNGRAYFIANGRRIHLDECLRTNI